MPVPRPTKVAIPNQRRRPLPPLDQGSLPNGHEARARKNWGRVRGQIRSVTVLAPFLSTSGLNICNVVMATIMRLAPDSKFC